VLLPRALNCEYGIERKKSSMTRIHAKNMMSFIMGTGGWVFRPSIPLRPKSIKRDTLQLDNSLELNAGLRFGSLLTRDDWWRIERGTGRRCLDIVGLL
jgi:hypothetical protein